MGLMDKIKKTSVLKHSAVLTESKVFKNLDIVDTGVPMINVALGGTINSGIAAGVTVFAGPSKHFKSNFALLIAAAFLRKHGEDAVLLFYDSEFGSKESYFQSFGIDPNQVYHSPVTTIEELKFDIVRQLKEIDRKDKVIIILDSAGNIASMKETDDAEAGKSVADMTRAKAFKSLFRMVTPKLYLNDIPFIAVNHTYKEMGLYPKDIVSGGTGIYYSADTIWIIGRRQEGKASDAKGVTGYNFIIKMEKSRYLKEGAKIPISVSWEEFVKPYSGLLEVAVLGKFIHKGKKGQSLGYSKMNSDTGEIEEKVYYEKDTHNAEFWDPLLANEKFTTFVEELYSIGHKELINFEEFEEVIDDE